MLVTDEILDQLRQYIETYESTVVVAYKDADDMQEKMLLYIASKKFVERYG